MTGERLMDSHFKIGDEVVIVKGFPDTLALHFATEMKYCINDGKIRKVKSIHRISNGELVYTLDNSWTWFEYCLEPAYDTSVPHYRVIRKIKSLQTIRKEKGYAF
jgi:hypothetical protein